MNVFLQTLIQIMRLLVYAGIGAVFNKCKIMPEAFKTIASRMVTKLLLPMLIMGIFIKNCNARTLTENAVLVLYGGMVFLIAVFIGNVCTKAMHIQDIYERNVVRYAYVFPNTGSFNTPLTLAFLGSAGMFYSSLFTFICTVMTYLWGTPQLMPLSSENSVHSRLKRLADPILIATFAGIILGLLGASEWMPQIVMESIDLFSNFYVPMSLMVAGFLFADYRLKDMLPDKRTMLFIIIRMIMLPLGLFMLLKAIRAPYYASYFAMTTMICPCGMNTIVFPASYGKDVSCVSRIVLGSTLASMITIPCMYLLMNVL